MSESRWELPGCELCRDAPADIDGRCVSCWLTLERFSRGVVTRHALELDAVRQLLEHPDPDTAT